MNKDGSPNVEIVRSVVLNIREEIPNANIVVRSTVLPGTCEELRCHFMPEFLTEKNYLLDFKCCKRWIFGMYPSENVEQEKILLKQIIDTAQHEECINFRTTTFLTTKEAEMIKYIRNTYLAVKVSYFNEISEYCKNKDIDFETVRELAVQDNRIGNSHTNVPGHDGKFGFGGTCFPKDTSALLSDMKKLNMNTYILNSAVARNLNVDRPEKDWESDVGRAVSEV